MIITRQPIVDMVYAAIDEANAARAGQYAPIQKSGRTALFGDGGAFDSLSLVHFIVSIEEQVSDTFKAEISLVTDEAMAREHSPFRTVDSIIDFVVELLEAHGCA